MISNSGAVNVSFMCATEEFQELARGRLYEIPKVGEVVDIQRGAKIRRFKVLRRRWLFVSTTMRSGYDYIDGNVTQVGCELWLEDEEISK